MDAAENAGADATANVLRLRPDLDLTTCTNVILTPGICAYLASPATGQLARRLMVASARTYGGCCNRRAGGSTAESRARIGVEVATYIDRYVREGCTQGAINFPTVETRPVKANHRRIINIHRNVRGVLTVRHPRLEETELDLARALTWLGACPRFACLVLQEINHILSRYNVIKQVGETRDNMGYVLIDVNTNEVTSDIVASLAMLSNSVRTRCV